MSEKWYPCHYKNFCLFCDAPDYEFEHGKWYRWLSNTGQTQEARYKLDAYDHFYPLPPLFEIDYAVGFQFLEDVDYPLAKEKGLIK